MAKGPDPAAMRPELLQATKSASLALTANGTWVDQRYSPFISHP